MSNYTDCPNCGGDLHKEKAGAYAGQGPNGTWQTTTAWRCTGECGKLHRDYPSTKETGYEKPDLVT
jgi:uncharacterized protein with PIN domain